MGRWSTELDGSHGLWISLCDLLTSKPMMGHGSVGHGSHESWLCGLSVGHGSRVRIWPGAMLSAVI